MSKELHEDVLKTQEVQKSQSFFVRDSYHQM